MWYRAYKTKDIGLIESQHILNCQSKGNIWDWKHHLDTRFIPGLRSVLSDSFGNPQLPSTKDFMKLLKYNPTQGQGVGYYDIQYKNLKLCRQDGQSVMKLSDQLMLHV